MFPSHEKDILVMRQHGAVRLLKVKLYRLMIGCEGIEMESGISWPAE